MLKIFVSSTTEDLKPYRVEVSALIRSLSFVDIAMEVWPAGPRHPQKTIEKMIGESDVYVGIIGHMYGTRLPGSSQSYTKYEYRCAGRLGKPRLLYLRDPKTCPLEEADVDRTKIEAWRREIARDQSYKTFRNEVELVREVSASLIELERTRGIPKYNALLAAEKLLLELRHLAYDDLIARRDQLENSRDIGGRTWFFGPLRRCNVGPRFYIPREALLGKLAAWFVDNKSPCLVLTGPSGIGKTNFLVELLQCVGRDPAPLAQQAVLPLSLGGYSPVESLASYLEKTLERDGSLSTQIDTKSLASLIKEGTVLLFLDGLDEFARNYSADECVKLFKELRALLDPVRSRVILTCRDHIYRRLLSGGEFGHSYKCQEIAVGELSFEEARAALIQRLGADSVIHRTIAANEKLLSFARSPLLLEMMCQIDRESWKRFARSQTRGQLYDLWFEEIIATGSEKDKVLTDDLIKETRSKVAAIARLMLESRCDLVSKADLDANHVPLERLRMPDTRPFGIFVEEAKDEWGFVHGSFREFTLAKTIEAELKNLAPYELLAHYDQLDYVGAELLVFLRDLFPDVEDLLNSYERALDVTKSDPATWDKVLWNAFDTIGNVGANSAERFIDTAMEILRPGPERAALMRPSYRTQYNIVRCVERLHRSAPRPHCDYVLKRAWPQHPDWENFGAFAIRGFQVAHPHPGYFPAMCYRQDQYRGDNPRQEKVSDCLLSLMEGMISSKHDGETYLEINCTFALIRWLHECHIPRAKELLGRGPGRGELSAMSRGNLFQAFLRFLRPEIFRGCTTLFQGMELAYCAIEPSMMPEDFIFRQVTFHEHRRSMVDGLSHDECIYK